MLGILETLYSTRMARIRLQGIFSDPIKIGRGTLIFAIMMESLAIAIPRNPNIREVQWCGPDIHKCALFADDILLFVTSPMSSLPEICSLLNKFSTPSGLKVKNLRFRHINVSLPDSIVSLLQETYDFCWSSSSIKYLGINVTSKI